MHRSLVRPVLLLVLGASLAACAGAAAEAGSAGSPPAANERVRRSPNRITLQEIESSGALDLLDLVQRLRPMWLRSRGAGTINRLGDEVVRVYVDGVAAGGPQALRGIPTSRVRSLRYLSASEATTKWGTGHARGAIEVSTR